MINKHIELYVSDLTKQKRDMILHNYKLMPREMKIRFVEQAVVINNLKRCPFCGSKPSFSDHGYDHRYKRRSMELSCQPCGLLMKIATNMDSSEYTYRELIDDLSKKWNKRNGS